MKKIQDASDSSFDVFLFFLTEVEPLGDNNDCLSAVGLEKARRLGVEAKRHFPGLRNIADVIIGMTTAHYQMLELTVGGDVPLLRVAKATTFGNVGEVYRDDECLKTAGGLSFSISQVLKTSSIWRLIFELANSQQYVGEAVILCDSRVLCENRNKGLDEYQWMGDLGMGMLCHLRVLSDDMHIEFQSLLCLD